jgi:hypothetical protein
MRRAWKMTYAFPVKDNLYHFLYVAVDRSGHRSTFLPARFNVCKLILNQLINRHLHHVTLH